MIEDYELGDPYLGFAKRIGLVPPDATKRSHPEVHEQLKVAAGLGVLYGAQAETVARSGNMTPAEARRVLRLHRSIYPTFWRWRESVISHAMLHGEMRTNFGWRWRLTEEDTARSASNFPMQANGAEMMRIAVCLAVERGIRVCCPVHDALLVEGPIECIDDVQTATLNCMREASRAVIGNGELRVGVEGPIVYPTRYSDKRGQATFDQILGLLAEVERSDTRVLPSSNTCVQSSDTCVPPVQFL
jgi:hypothetical protein